MRARQGHMTSPRYRSWPITSSNFGLRRLHLLLIGTLACLVTLCSAGPRLSSRIVETKTGSIRGVLQELPTKHLDPVEVSNLPDRTETNRWLKLNYQLGRYSGPFHMHSRRWRRSGSRGRKSCSSPGKGLSWPTLSPQFVLKWVERGGGGADDLIRICGTREEVDP